MRTATIITTLLPLSLSLLNLTCGSEKYQPTWDSLDKRPLPKWFDRAKVGIFIHWGVFSVPSFGSEWFWQRWRELKRKEFVQFMQENYPPNFTYQDFAKEFTAEFFDPDQWAELFAKSGAKYVVLTTKHHEGFTLWPSKYSFSWNAQDVGPNRDLVGALAQSIRAKNLHFGLYHSLFEWFNPMYLTDRNNSFTTSDFVDFKVLPEMQELVERYRPEVLWSDGDGEATDTYWKSTEFLAWLYNDSPVKDFVVTNDRWGNGSLCKHGDFFTCGDRSNPGHLFAKKWENCMTLDSMSWGYRRNARLEDYLTTFELIKTLAQTVSCGGNILINVGPTKEGTIIPIFQERLLDLGKWLSINGEAIYESQAWLCQNNTKTNEVRYTARATSVYAIVLFWPRNNNLLLTDVKKLFTNTNTQVSLLGNRGNLDWKLLENEVRIRFPDKASVVSEWAWVLKITPST